MTYNFNPDRWYENERRALDSLLQQGKIDKDAYKSSLENLDQRYEQMVDRLTGLTKLNKSDPRSVLPRDAGSIFLIPRIDFYAGFPNPQPAG